MTHLLYKLWYDLIDPSNTCICVPFTETSIQHRCNVFLFQVYRHTVHCLYRSPVKASFFIKKIKNNKKKIIIIIIIMKTFINESAY